MRIPRGWCRHCQLLVCIAAVLCCLLLLAERALDRPCLSMRTDTVCQCVSPTPDVSQDSHSSTFSFIQNAPQDFACSANDDIPPQLPQQFQEFLRYRHCRAFPTLLTPSPCEDDLFLLLVVKSTAANAERRDAVRDTWGHAGQILGQQIKLVFLLGRSRDQPKLEWESHRHGDILQWDFMDVFFNLTRKEIGFLSWFSQKCSKAQFVFKGDDDVFVNTDNVVEFLKAHNPDSHLFTGYIHGHGGPSRDRNSKYLIPIEIYPNESYPPFPSGGGYLMSRQTVLGLQVAAEQIALYPLDDIFVAFCLHAMGLIPKHHHGFLTFGFSRPHQHSDPCAYRDIMMMHNLYPAELRRMWRRTKDPSLACRS